jgi:hypothetical protein
MATVTINGTDLDNDDPKTVRKALAKVRREEKKAEQVRSEASDVAYAEAQANGYKVLSRKASGESFPDGWRLYRPGDKWAQHLFTTGEDDDGNDFYRGWTTRLSLSSNAFLRHYGNDFLGAVCNGSGFAWLVFLQEVNFSDASRGPILCYAVGSHDGVVRLADCPGIDMSDFQSSNSD